MRFAVLSAGFRPATEGVLVHAAGTKAVRRSDVVDIYIEEDGEMFAEPRPGNNGDLVSLEGVTFFAG